MTKPHRELLVENEKLEAEIVALKEEKGIKCKYHGSKMLYCSTCVEKIYAQGWMAENEKLKVKMSLLETALKRVRAIIDSPDQSRVNARIAAVLEPFEATPVTQSMMEKN